MGESGYTESGYLNNYDYWWTMSPFYFGNGTAVMFGGFEDGDLGIDHVVNEFGVRPAVSLKPGAIVTTGEGTAAKPYIIQ
jgi:hypothetical protein